MIAVTSNQRGSIYYNQRQITIKAPTDADTGEEYLFGGCGIRPGPGRGAAGSVGPHFALVLELFQDEPDGLVADTWNGSSDVGKTESGRRVAQDMLADTLLLGSRRPS
jgi:hypothetical protein